MKQENFGLSRDSVIEISRSKGEPGWMLTKRLEAWDDFIRLPYPSSSPDLRALDLSKIQYYTPSEQKAVKEWSELPDKIQQSFDELRGDEIRKELAAGYSAQYDSQMVLHTLSASAKHEDIVYLGLEDAIRDKKYEALVQKYFAKIFPASEHKFAALHYAFWSGGTFIYIPKGKKLGLPLQAYCRFEAAGAGQFGHTLIVLEEGAELHFIEACSAPKHEIQAIHAACVEIFVGKNAKLKYSAIENWPKNIYNLNSKRAIVEENGRIEWISGLFGSSSCVVYPSTILKGEGASVETTSVSVAGEKQNYDTGMKVYFESDNCSSHAISKSIAQKGGSSVFRALITNKEKAQNCTSFVDCESLLLDENSKIQAIPNYKINGSGIEISHEASVGKISEEKLDFLRARGISNEEAKALIVRGFANGVSKELPRAYATEMNKILKSEFKV